MKKLYILIFCAAVSLNVFAQNKLDRIIESIVASNPELAALKAQTAVDVASLAPENNLTDPEVEFTHQWGQKGIGTKWGIDASQSFDWPGLYSSRKKANEAVRHALEMEYEVKLNEVKYEARCGLTDAFFARKKIMLQTHQLNIIDSLQKIYDKGASRGEVSLLDVNKLKIERIRVAAKLTDAQIAYDNAVGKLQLLSKGNIAESLPGLDEYDSPTLLPASVYISRAVESSPYIGLSEARRKANDAQLDVNRKAGLPGFSVGYMHEYELGDHFNGVKIGMTLPVFSNRHKKEVLLAQQELNNVDLENKLAEIETDINSDCSKIIRLDKDINSYIEVLTTNDNPRLLGIALGARHITLIQYLTEMNYFLDAAECLIDLQVQREQIMNRLLRY